MSLVLVVRLVLPCGLTVSAVLQPLLPFSRIGPSPVFWMRLHDDPILFLLRFNLRICSLCTKVCVRWVRS